MSLKKKKFIVKFLKDKESCFTDAQLGKGEIL